MGKAPEGIALDDPEWLIPPEEGATPDELIPGRALVGMKGPDM